MDVKLQDKRDGFLSNRTFAITKRKSKCVDIFRIAMLNVPDIQACENPFGVFDVGADALLTQAADFD